MNSYMILFIIAAYFAVLLLIAWITGRNNSNEAFFLGNRKSPWYIVSIGMVGTSLSGGDVRIGTRHGAGDRYDVYADCIRLLRGIYHYSQGIATAIL